MQGLIDRVGPNSMSNLHSFGEWILYPQGWQIGTLDADNPVYVALAGTDAQAGHRRVRPGPVGGHPVRDERRDDRLRGHRRRDGRVHARARRWRSGGGFVFPDDEALVQAEFQRALPFHLALARSALDPDDPVSPSGIDTPAVLPRPGRARPAAQRAEPVRLHVHEVYGDPQEVRILAKRSLGAVTLRYRINGGDVQSKPTTVWNGGERYGAGAGAHYRVVRAEVTGTTPGDSVEVWFTGGGATSPSFTYTAISESGRRTLVLAAEDYTGFSPQQPGVTAPQYLDSYADALTANGVAFDVYDVDANGRTAPDNLGVLSHYDAVLWYTGDDVVTREPDWGPGNASRLAMQEQLEVRDFMNEGGRVLYTGKFAGQQYTTALGTQLYDPFENLECDSDPAIEARCLPLSGSGDSQGDVVEYWLGAAITTPDAGLDPDTFEPFPIDGIDDPLDGLSFELNGPDSAQNQDTDSAFIATSDYLAITDPAGSFPQFESWPSAVYRSGIAGPYDPHGGTQFVWSQLADEGYKRLSRPIDLTGVAGATLSFWTSYNLEFDFDYMIVEAHTVGQDDWTTLPDVNGHTSDDLSFDQACIIGWSSTNGPEAQPPVPRALPDPQRGRDLLQHRLDRLLERRNRRLGRLAAVGGRPQRLRRPAGRGVDHRPERLGHPAIPGRVHRRHRGVDRRGQHLVRG